MTVPFPRRFAERVDLIVLLFDPFKLDISDELTGVIRRFRGHEDKVRVVLNKSADSASVSELQYHEDGVSRRRDAVDVSDGINQRR